MKKWAKCCECQSWILPGSFCQKCNQPKVDSKEDVISIPITLEQKALGKIVEKGIETKKPNLIECESCLREFDPNSKHFGKRTECLNCAEETEVKLTGVMIGGKNAAEIQINSDPKLTEYMLKARMSGNSATGISKRDGQVKKVVKGIENRRHGDSV
jgi:hypothetical protein